MAYWLVKSEPSKWSWQDHVDAGVAEWDGVRNHQAASNLQAMKSGDKAFFYHSNEGKEIVGVLEVVKEYYPDPSDESGKFGMVDFKAVEPIPNPVSLSQIKADPQLADIPLIKQSRLSVMPIPDQYWTHICLMGGLGREQ